MEVSVNKRINMILGHFGKTPNGLANMLQMIPSTVNRQLKGDQALSSKVIEGVLFVFPDVSAEWLLRGKGEMLLSDTDVNLAKMQDDDSVKSNREESIWKAKYEAIKECYDILASNIGGVMGKRNVG